MNIFEATIVIIALAAVIKSCLNFLKDWIDMLFPGCIEYRYVVYFYTLKENFFYSGRFIFTLHHKITSLAHFRVIEDSIVDTTEMEDASICGFNLLGKRNVAGKRLRKAIRRAFTRTADDAVSEYKTRLEESKVA